MKSRSMGSSGSEGDTFGAWARSILVFGSYYLYFTFADLSVSLKKYESLLSPDLTAYTIWLVIYTIQFAFVCYQLFNTNARKNPLVNRKLIVPYILHQLLFAAWLKTFESGWMLLSGGLYTGLWLMTFICYLLITSEFRNGDFEGYKLQSWFMIEVPFALLLGWETYTLLVNWNSVVVLLGTLTGFVIPATELAAFIISLLLIVQAAVLFAGLSILMNPFLHIGLVWGCTFTSMRLLKEESPTRFMSPNLAVIPRASGIAVAFTGLIAALYLIVSLAILCQSRFCIPDGDDELIGRIANHANHANSPNAIEESENRIPYNHNINHPPPSAPACVIPISSRSGSNRRINNLSLPPPATRMVI